MKLPILTVLLAGAAATSPARSTDLYCTGDGWLTVGESFKHQVLMTLDPNTFQATVQTFSGTATGQLRQQPQLYLGMLAAPNGKQYWINLDRFSGELLVSKEPEKHAEFLGTCREAQPRF